MIPTNLNDIAISNILGADNCCIINRIGKCQAVNLLKNADLSKKSGTWQNIFLSCMKDR